MINHAWPSGSTQFPRRRLARAPFVDVASVWVGGSGDAGKSTVIFGNSQSVHVDVVTSISTRPTGCRRE